MVNKRRRQTPFSLAALTEQIERLPPVKRYWVAYSGGLDSHVLLHALSHMRDRLSATINAVHVDHGLQEASHAWARHCAAVCASLAVPLTSLRVDARPAPGGSREAAARDTRYRALADLVVADDVVLTAHHQDDQAETLLLQLLRGGGPHGLAAMAECVRFSRGWHARPLLGFPHSELRRYAEQHGLRWIDDPSNTDARFDRNYLRHSLMPLLRARWPAVSRVLARDAAHQAEAARLLDALAAQDMERCRGEGEDQLRITALMTLDEARQRNLLRYWIKRLGYPLPDSVRLAQIQHTVLRAAPDREPKVDWEGVELRRYRDVLYAVGPSSMTQPAEWSWDMTSALRLDPHACLIAVPARGAGIRRASCAERRVTVRYRQGGELCRPAPRAHLRPLKKLLQERGVPPWRRARLPLIYIDDQLAAVADLWVCAPFHAAGDEEGLRIEWREICA